MIFTSITCPLMASFAMFPQFSKLRTSARDVFAQKQFLEDLFNSEICYRYDYLGLVSYNAGSNLDCKTVVFGRFGRSEAP